MLNECNISNMMNVFQVLEQVQLSLCLKTDTNPTWRSNIFLHSICFLFVVESSTKLFHFVTQLEEGKQLVRDAIAAGIFCDLGSGSNVDLCVITEKGVEYLRGYDTPVQKGQR